MDGVDLSGFGGAFFPGFIIISILNRRLDHRAARQSKSADQPNRKNLVHDDFLQKNLCECKLQEFYIFGIGPGLNALKIKRDMKKTKSLYLALRKPFIVII